MYIPLTTSILFLILPTSSGSFAALAKLSFSLFSPFFPPPPPFFLPPSFPVGTPKTCSSLSRSFANSVLGSSGSPSDESDSPPAVANMLLLVGAVELAVVLVRVRGWEELEDEGRIGVGGSVDLAVGRGEEGREGGREEG
jgi:hypothetical protein